MKRLLGTALAACALVGMLALPAGAEVTKEQCKAFDNSSGGKSVEICAQVISDFTSPQHRYGKVEFNWLTSPSDLPYAVHVKTIFWSSSDGGNLVWCAGYIITCAGGGNANSTFRPLAASDSDATDHYGDSEHWCTYHTEVQGDIYWTQTQWQNGQSDPFDFNSPNVLHANTHCVGT
jgi:hypothetical protein